MVTLDSSPSPPQASAGSREARYVLDTSLTSHQLRGAGGPQPRLRETAEAPAGAVPTEHPRRGRAPRDRPAGRPRPPPSALAPRRSNNSSPGGGAGRGRRGCVRGAGSQPPLPPPHSSRAPHRAGRGLCDAEATAADTKGRRGGERGAGPAPVPAPATPAGRTRAPARSLASSPSLGLPGVGSRPRAHPPLACAPTLRLSRSLRWDRDAAGPHAGSPARLLGGAEAAAGLPARGWMPRACGSLRFPPSRGARHGRRGR